jgi:S1-C subfamily serine protease
MQGRIVGIVSYILSQTGGYQGLGFVISSNMARRLLLEDRTMWSGIDGRTLDGEMARLLNVPQPESLLVQRVAARSPAAHLGLKGGTYRLPVEGEEWILGGDIILEVMGIQIGSPEDREKIRERMRALKDGDPMTVEVLRGGEIVELKNFYFPDILLPKELE